MKLGKLIPRIDRRTLKFKRYAGDLPLAAASADWTIKVADWKMLLNDKLSCCCVSGLGHIVQAITSFTEDYVNPTDLGILEMYEAVGGYNPNDPTTDNGAVELDVLNYMVKTGFLGFKIDAFADIDIDGEHEELVKLAIALFGSADIGVSLPKSAMDSAGDGGVWSNTRDTHIVGGHALPLLAYDRDELVCITWGQKQRMTWQWFEQYSDEAHCPLWFKQAPSGLDIATLRKDLWLIRQ